MTGFARLRNAARRRARLMRETDESGYILLYVLLVSMLITGMIATVTTSAMNAAVPAQQSTYSLSATSAAQGAIQAYYAKLLGTTSCLSLNTLATNSGACTGLGTGSTSGRITLSSADGSYGFTTANQVHYSWKVVSVVPSSTGGFVRVQGTGEIGQPGTGLYTSKTLTADISGGGDNFGNYGYYSTYETLSSAEIQKEFAPNRTIAYDTRDPLYQAGVTNITALAATTTNPTTVTWGGVPTTGSTGSQWCNAVYYTPANPASTLNAATGGQGRYTHVSSLPTGYDWAETVTGGPLTGTTHDGICQVDFTTGNHMTGPLISQDAYLLSYGTKGGAGPQFDQPAYSAWSSKDLPAAAAPYNTFPIIGGGTKGNQNPPTTRATVPMLPADASASLTDNTATQVCQYTGPTRIYVKGGTAYITSPMTAAVGGNPCYQSYPDAGQTAGNVPSGTLSGGGMLPGAGSPSVLQAHVSVANTLIYVHDAKLASTSTWNNQAIFNVSGSNAIGSVLDSSTTTVTKASMSNMSGLPHNATLGGAVINSDSTLKGSTTGSLSSDFLSALQTGFQSSQGTPLYTNAAAAGTPSGSNTDAYYVTLSPTSDPAPTAYNDSAHPDPVLDPSGVCPSTTAPAPDSRLAAPVLGDGDPLLGQQAQGTSQKSTTCTSKTVNATIYHLSAHCSFWLVVCITYSGWDTSTAGTASATRVVRSSTTTVVTAPNTSFPLSTDVTRYQTYQNGPGDAYIEGNVTGKLSLVTDHDVVVTGNLTANDGSSGTALIADDNVRVYHPVSCVDTTASSIAATTPGYCPNDTTGLSPVGKLYFGPANFTEHPSRQYQNLPATSAGTPLQNVTINAAVYALNGSFIVDNYDRGDGYGWNSSGSNFGLQSDGLNTLTLVGGVYQQHHGAAGVQWPIMTTDTQRPTSGYITTITYQSTQGLGLPYVPNPAGGNGAKPWKINSISTGTGSGGSS